MLYRFYVFHNYLAVADHRDFVAKKLITDEREREAYEALIHTLPDCFLRAGEIAKCERTTGASGLDVSVQTNSSLFAIESILASALVRKNDVVEGLFLDFVQV